LGITTSDKSKWISPE
jgi:hypothetical protein